MSNNLTALDANAVTLEVIFVSVDPERDASEYLRTYLAAFDARIIGLTGTPDQIAHTAKQWGAFYAKLPEPDGSYSITHSAHVYLMDRNHRPAGSLNFQQSQDEQLAKLRALLGGR